MSSNLPRLRVPVHVFVFGLFATPTFAYAWYYGKYKKNDEEMEELLKAKYSHNIQKSKANREEMSKMFQAAMEKPSSRNPDMAAKLDAALKGERVDGKRLTAVDEKLHGTEQGETQQADKKKKKKKMKANPPTPKKEAKSGVNADQEKQQTESESAMTTALATASIVGIVAVAGFLLGGGRNNR